MNVSDSRGEMRKISIAVTLLTLILPLGAQAQKMAASVGEPPDPGVTDEFLISLGTAVDSFLISRLESPEHERFRLGVISRLTVAGDLSKPHPQVAAALTRLIESSADCQGNIPSEKLYLLRNAMKALGQRGGKDAVTYLTEWALGDKYSDRFKCQVERASIATTYEGLQTAAIAGIGFNGTAFAQSTLLQIKGSPAARSSKSIAATIERSLRENDKIQRLGIETVRRDEIGNYRKRASKTQK